MGDLLAAEVGVGQKMAAEARAGELLAQMKDVLTSEGQSKEEAETQIPARVLAEHAVNTRKTHKLMYTQLQVMKFLLDFLDSAPCIQEDSNAAVRKEMIEAKQQWKALKAEYQQQVELIKGAVPPLLAKLKEGEKRSQLLESALQRYQAKKQEMEDKAKIARSKHQKAQQKILCEQQQQLERRVAELQEKLQKHRQELQSLQGIVEEQEGQVCAWREKLQRMLDLQSHLEILRGVKLISVSETDLEIELTSPSEPKTSDPHHLKVHLHWADDGTVTLQTDNPFFSASDLPVGTASTIRGVVLELQHNFFQQAQLLSEIELLQNCFAIDWQQEKRLLHYLKPSSTCSLYVEPGYAANGEVRLISVKSQHGTVDVTSYRPPQEKPSLMNWLVYLSTVDFSAPFLAQKADDVCSS
uniref:ZW10 interacting kinetochore protein n=1 Tax=Anolis carolinensis TaxID=28377 RepID=G1KFB5_ANOCA|nr:PREDICTED: ZW10 interactor isoform X1 [Anolis carolinensis]|eukprot:XP_003216707.2 PREDICTED: ZW10 interactor isoform X1 [Anolis carolinensis]